MKLWEKVKKDVLAESLCGADGAWTSAKEDRAIERYVEAGGQYEDAEPPEKIPGAHPTGGAAERLTSEATEVPAAQTADIQDFMTDVEAASET